MQPRELDDGLRFDDVLRPSPGQQFREIQIALSALHQYQYTRCSVGIRTQACAIGQASAAVAASTQTPEAMSVLTLIAVNIGFAHSLAVTALAESHSELAERRIVESALGRSLFLRRARGLALTDEGRAYLPTVQAAFAMLEEGTAVLQGRNDPDVLELQVNLSFALFWLTPRLGRFMDENPGVHLNLVTSVWNEERRNDAAALQIVFGVGKSEGISGKRLTRDTLFPVCSPAVAKRIRTLDDLLAQRLFDLTGTVQSWDAWLAAHPQGSNKAVPAVHRASTWALKLAATPNRPMVMATACSQ